MKSILVLTALIFSFNSFANSVTAPVRDFTLQLSSMTEFSSDGLDLEKEARVVLADANAFYATGEISATLQAHIKNVQSDVSVSELEAVDVLVETAQKILTKI